MVATLVLAEIQIWFIHHSHEDGNSLRSTGFRLSGNVQKILFSTIDFWPTSNRKHSYCWREVLLSQTLRFSLNVGRLRTTLYSRITAAEVLSREKLAQIANNTMDLISSPSVAKLIACALFWFQDLEKSGHISEMHE